MKKIILLFFKILPLLTIYQGISSGGARLNPYVDTLKVALTQYEVAQILKLVFDDFEKTNGPVIAPKEFSSFLSEKYHNQYSVLARELSGLDSQDQTVDIWGQSFQLIVNSDVTLVKVSSAGPDKTISNKDDVCSEFTIQREAPVKKPVLAEETQDSSAEDSIPEEENREPASVVETDLHPDFDEDGFDQHGFNQAGYDRDGYDMNGMHQSEKEIQYAASDIDQ